MTTRLPRIIVLLFSLLLVQLAPGCAAPQQLARHAPGPALWKVADKDTTIYLFGTIHALPKDVEWYAPHIGKALESSDELVTEVGLDDTVNMPALVLGKAMLPEGENLRNLLEPETRKSFEEAMVSLGLPVQAFDGYKPWYAAMTLSIIPLLNAGYDTDAGVETVLTQQFPADKAHTHLETAEFQLDLFDKLPREKQITYLRAVLASIPELTGQLDAMVKQWLLGDADGLARLINAQETDPAIYKRLITDRNASWALWIGQRLKQPGTVFIAVGAGHLAGKGSVQEKLRQRGIKSQRVE